MDAEELKRLTAHAKAKEAAMRPPEPTPEQRDEERRLKRESEYQKIVTGLDARLREAARSGKSDLFLLHHGLGMGQADYKRTFQGMLGRKYDVYYHLSDISRAVIVPEGTVALSVKYDFAYSRTIDGWTNSEWVVTGNPPIWIKGYKGINPPPPDRHEFQVTIEEVIDLIDRQGGLDGMIRRLYNYCRSLGLLVIVDYRGGRYNSVVGKTSDSDLMLRVKW